MALRARSVALAHPLANHTGSHFRDNLPGLAQLDALRRGPGGQDPAAARARRVTGLIVLLWVLSAADLGFTLWAHYWTPFVEANPVAARLLGESYWSVVLLKLVTVGVGTLIFWRVRKFVAAEVGMWLLVVALTGLAVLWSDYTHASLKETEWVGISLEHAPATQAASATW